MGSSLPSASSRVRGSSISARRLPNRGRKVSGVDIRAGNRVPMEPLSPTHPPFTGRSAAALLAAGLVALSLGVAATASADSSGDLAEARAQLAALTSRIHDAEAQRDALKTQISDLLARIDANRRALEREQPQIETIRSTVTDVTAQVAANQA